MWCKKELGKMTANSLSLYKGVLIIYMMGGLELGCRKLHNPLFTEPKLIPPFFTDKSYYPLSMVTISVMDNCKEAWSVAQANGEFTSPLFC